MVTMENIKYEDSGCGRDCCRRSFGNVGGSWIQALL